MRSRTIPREILLGDPIQLHANLLEGAIQVKGRRADAVAAHAVGGVGLDILVGGGVEEHARDLDTLPRALEGHLLVLHVREDLVEVPRMHGPLVEVALHRGGVVLRVDDEDAAASAQCDVAAHGGQPIRHAVVERPVDEGRAGVQTGMFLAVVLEDELLVEAAHALLVEEIHHAHAAVALGLKQPFDDEPAYGHQHAVGAVVAVIAHVPVDRVQVDIAHVCEEDHELLQALLARLRDVRAHEQRDRCLDDAVHRCIDAELVVGAHQLAAQQRLRLHGFGDLDFAAQAGARLGPVHVLLPEASFELEGYASLEDGGAQLGRVVEVLRGHGAVPLLGERRESVGEHVEDVADAKHLGNY